MTDNNIKDAISLMENFIKEYEEPYIFKTDSKAWQRRKQDNYIRITTALEILSIVTGKNYCWSEKESKIYVSNK